jgi:putative ABC transport system substrate-binding protein
LHFEGIIGCEESCQVNWSRVVLPALWLAAGLQLAPLESKAQQAGKVVRIGYLSGLTAASDEGNLAAFRQGLQALGYQEGNVRVEVRHANGNTERLPGLAAEIAHLGVDVIVAATTPAVRAAQQAMPKVPVVMAFAGDPVGDGLVTSLARPGGMTTGFSAAVTEIAAKRVEYMHAIVPKATHLVLLAAPTASVSMVAASEKAGRVLGMQVNTVRIRNSVDVTRALSGDTSERIDGVIVDLGIPRNLSQILEVANRRRLVTVSGPRAFAVAGGVIAYGANYPDLFRRSALFVDLILKGANPADIPVQQPTRFELIVNLKAARALGVTVPPSLLLRADEVIE